MEELNGTTKDLEWTVLDQLKTFNTGFRQGVDEVFDINNVTENGVNGKNGCLYVGVDEKRNGNNSFMDGLRNRNFELKYMINPETTKKLSELSAGLYADVDKNSEYAVAAAFNAYYNLFPSELKGEDYYFNANSLVGRDDFYSFMFRASSGVKEIERDLLFEGVVISNDQTALFASQVDEYAFLNTNNHSLRQANYTGSMTRAEAIFMLMNMYFSDDMYAMNVKDIKLVDAKNGGDMLGRKDILYTKEDGSKVKTPVEGWELGVLSKMQASGNKKVHVDIYKALGLANKLGLVGQDTRWNEPITRGDTIEL